jgi:hypothetical protein
MKGSFFFNKKKVKEGEEEGRGGGEEQLGMMAHVCNPSYSRGRDRRTASSTPAWAT